MPKRADPRPEATLQCGAICWRPRRTGAEVLLITSRDTGRWVIPKGWPMEGRTLAEAAAQEAWEEAGVRGEVETSPAGFYAYVKPERGEDGLPVEVVVFLLEVRKLHKRFPEHEARRRHWVSPREAAEMVAEPGLQRLLLLLDETL